MKVEISKENIKNSWLSIKSELATSFKRAKDVSLIDIVISNILASEDK